MPPPATGVASGRARASPQLISCSSIFLRHGQLRLEPNRELRFEERPFDTSTAVEDRGQITAFAATPGIHELPHDVPAARDLEQPASVRFRDQRVAVRKPLDRRAYLARE